MVAGTLPKGGGRILPFGFFFGGLLGSFFLNVFFFFGGLTKREEKKGWSGLFRWRGIDWVKNLRSFVIYLIDKREKYYIGTFFLGVEVRCQGKINGDFNKVRIFAIGAFLYMNLSQFLSILVFCWKPCLL